MLGPGKYDSLCTLVRQISGAEVGAVIIVLGGKLGNGFCVQVAPGAERELPGVFRDVAAQIEADFEKLRQ
jgi:hypothetical protein